MKLAGSRFLTSQNYNMFILDLPTWDQFMCILSFGVTITITMIIVTPNEVKNEITNCNTKWGDAHELIRSGPGEGGCNLLRGCS